MPSIRVRRVRCGVYEYEKGGAIKFAQTVALAFATWMGVLALLLAIAAPAEAKKKRKPVEKPVEDLVLDSPNREPLTLVISLSDQELDLYQGTTLIISSRVSTGMSGYETKPGVFSILQKKRHHHSNMFSNAPMPWMQRLTRSGTALHAGVVPNYPASHGCIRLPFSFAPKLYKVTAIGGNVVIAQNRPVPKLIEHPNLFQPNQLSQQTNDASGSPAEDAALSPEKRGAITDSSSKVATEESTELGTAGRLNTEATNEGDHAIGTTTSEDARSHAIDPSMTSNTGGPAGAKNHSISPLRILVTRRTKRDHIIGVQRMLSSLGYLKPQKFTGRLGKETVTAIKAFQRANDMRETETFTDDFAKKVYEVAGKEEPAEGHLFVRQDFRRVFDVPVVLRRSNQPLGTHIYTAMKFETGDIRANWMAISVEGGESASALDRIEIPTEVRQKISEMLTPGSSLIIADTSANSAILPEGDDFLVAAKDTASNTGTPKAKQATKQAKAKKAKVKQAKAAPNAAKPRTAARIVRKRERLAWRYYAYEPPRRFRRQRFYSRW